jgi:hypothetical protein
MGEHHRQEYVSSIDGDDQNLGKNDDFHVTEFWSTLVEPREFRVSTCTTLFACVPDVEISVWHRGHSIARSTQTVAWVIHDSFHSVETNVYHGSWFSTGAKLWHAIVHKTDAST